MSNPWAKFFWQDWETDAALKLCSLAAQGLWMRMLCIAAQHDPIGYVAVAGIGLDETGIARLTGATESEVQSLLGELARAGVFSRDTKGRIYSRRMVRDARKAATARKNGKKGGNPNLCNKTKKSGWVNLPDKGGVKPHKPEAISQNKKENKSLSQVRLPDWVPKEEWRDYEDMRVKQRKPMTDRARALALAELDRLRAGGNDPKVVLERSIMNGWLGLFSVPKDFAAGAGPTEKSSELAMARRILAERERSAA